MLNYNELEAKCLWVRRKVLEMAVKANSGHVSTAMSQTEILVSLYFGGVLNYDPKNPKDPNRDVFLLSKGQGGIGLYPILANAGFFPEEDLDNFCGVGSHIGVHAEWHCPGVEMVSGSLGHGLPVATGICQAFKNDKKDNLVYCLVGDGELQEGSNWEALMFAGWHQLNNLVLIVDRNGQNTLGRTDGDTKRDGPGLNPLGDKLEAFGFDVWWTDGHNIEEILYAMKVAKQPRESKRPFAIIACTKKGKGLSCMEDARNFHYKVPTGKDLDQCWDDLKVPVEARPIPSTSEAKHAVGMRDRFFETLFQHFKRDKNMVLITADNGAPTMDQFATLEGQFYQVGIAEQQMVGMASGMAMMGKKVWVYAIAPFVTTRVHEFVKLDACAANLPICLVGPGAGFSYAIMCVTHHNVEDVSIMRALPNLTIFSPADGVTAEVVADFTADMNTPSYVRLDRGGVDNIYGQCSETRGSQGLSHIRVGKSPVCIISTGIMVHEALKVAEHFDFNVIDAFRLKPFNSKLLLKILSSFGAERVITLEEHQLNGGLGSIVAETFVDNNILVPLLRVGIQDRFSFEMGGREELWRVNGLDFDSVVNKINSWQENLSVGCGSESCCNLER